MTAAAAFSDLFARGRRFAGDRDGISAVEFAIMLPFMLTLYIGGAELGDGMSVQFKATLAARTVADLTSQYESIDAPTMGQILGAAQTVMTPYPANNMAVTVSEITTTNGNGSATVTWSCSLNGTPRVTGAAYILPTALRTLPANTSLLLGEVTYPYTPTMGYVITGTINMHESSFFFPRMSTSVTDNSAC